MNNYKHIKRRDAIAITLLIIAAGLATAIPIVTFDTGTERYLKGSVIDFEGTVIATNDTNCLITTAQLTVTGPGMVVSFDLPTEYGNYADYNGLGIDVVVSETNPDGCVVYGGENTYTYAINWPSGSAVTGIYEGTLSIDSTYDATAPFDIYERPKVTIKPTVTTKTTVTVPTTSTTSTTTTIPIACDLLCIENEYIDGTCRSESKDCTDKKEVFFGLDNCIILGKPACCCKPKPTPCNQYCQEKGYLDGVCREESGRCLPKKEVYDGGGDCTGMIGSESCCCVEVVEDCDVHCKVKGHKKGVCRKDAVKCTEYDEVDKGDQYCPRKNNKNNCCCTPKPMEPPIQPPPKDDPTRKQTTTTITTDTLQIIGQSTTTIIFTSTTLQEIPDALFPTLDVEAPMFIRKGTIAEVKVTHEGIPVKSRVTVIESDGTKRELETDEEGLLRIMILTTGRTQFIANKPKYFKGEDNSIVIDLSELLFHPYSLTGLLLVAASILGFIWIKTKSIKVVFSQNFLEIGGLEKLMEEDEYKKVYVSKKAYEMIGTEYFGRINYVEITEKDSEKVMEHMRTFGLDDKNAEAIVIAEKIGAKKIIVLEKDVDWIKKIVPGIEVLYPW